MKTYGIGNVIQVLVLFLVLFALSKCDFLGGEDGSYNQIQNNTRGEEYVCSTVGLLFQDAFSCKDCIGTRFGDRR